MSAPVRSPKRLRAAVAACSAAIGLLAGSSPPGAATAPPQPAATPRPAPAPRRNIGGPGDYALRERLIHMITRDPDLGQERFNLVLVNGGAVFSGPIKTCALKNRLFRLAALTRGVVNVTDEMSVSRADLPDEALREAAAGSLQAAAELIGLKNLRVTVEDGVATLEGTVKDFPARVRGEEIAGSVMGVTRVVNHLKPSDAPSGADDASLLKAILGYLGDARQFTFPADIRVAVSQGVVTLAGRVNLYIARQQAGVMASLVQGTARVDNRIKVDLSTFFKDTTVKAAP